MELIAIGTENYGDEDIWNLQRYSEDSISGHDHKCYSFVTFLIKRIFKKMTTVTVCL